VVVASFSGSAQCFNGTTGFGSIDFGGSGNYLFCLASTVEFSHSCGGGADDMAVAILIGVNGPALTQAVGVWETFGMFLQNRGGVCVGDYAWLIRKSSQRQHTRDNQWAGDDRGWHPHRCQRRSP
jgi:hypothetical protein